MDISTFLLIIALLCVQLLCCKIGTAQPVIADWDDVDALNQSLPYFSATELSMAPRYQQFHYITDPATARYIPEAQWGVGMVYRHVVSPFFSSPRQQNDLIPLLYYHGEQLYLRGDYGGLRLMRFEQWMLAVTASYRFCDISQELAQAPKQGNSIDPGLTLEYQFSGGELFQFEWLSDKHQASYGQLNYRQQFDWEAWDFATLYRFRYKTAAFNNRYYGFDAASSPGADFDLTLSAQARYHLYQNLYLLGKLSLTQLNDKTSQQALFSSATQGEVMLGFGLFKDKQSRYNRTLDNHYIRLSYGYGSLANLSEIVTLADKSDPFNNRFLSFFYGIPLANSVFELPVDIFLTPGVVWHLASEVQQSFAEYVVAVKGYYHVNWPCLWRFGIAEGLSYSREVSWVEQIQMQTKGYEPSPLMNYLDLSLDLNIGDLFSAPQLNALWVGYGIHHRSGLFGKSRSFGNVEGGSNYHTLYFQWHW